MRQLLTATKVKALYSKPEPSMTTDGGGLYFRKRNNSASWVVRRSTNKVARFATIGRYPDMSLAEARQALSRFSSTSVADKTVTELLEDWYSQNEPNWRRPEQMRGYIRRFSADCPALVATKIVLVSLSQVRQALRGYASTHGNVAANRLMEILKQVFRHAVQVGYLEHSPLTELTRKVVGGAETPRSRVLTDRELRLLWHAKRHARLFRLLILTGQRIRETQLAQWQDIDHDRWFIPAANNKSGRDHWVALSDQARSILGDQHGRHGRVFDDVSPTAVQAYLRRWCIGNKIGMNNRELQHQGAFTPHDLRRTFATRLNDLGVGPHVVEKVLNHRLSGVMAVYNHADYKEERIAAMQTWADELEKIISK